MSDHTGAAHQRAVPEGQEQRYRRALARFRELYGSGPVSVFRAPGRANLIGEHTDYSQGYVLPVALDRDVLLLARPRADGEVHLANVESDYEPCAFPISPAIPSAAGGHWSNYARGAAQMVAERYGVAGGMDALVCGEPPHGVPRGAGLSSSSALVVATAVALCGLNGATPPPAELAEACGRAEWYVGTRGGIMDHFASMLSRPNAALLLDCRRDQATGAYPTRHVPLPDDVRIVIVDSGVRHSNTGPLYNTRVAEVRSGVALLRTRYPSITALRDLEGVPEGDWLELLPERVSVEQLRERGIALENLLEQGIIPDNSELQVRARCRHVVSENARVLAAAQALAAGDVARLGALLDEAHASLRDLFGVSTPEIESLIACARRLRGVYGARLTGAGWGGCIVALVDARQAEGFRQEIGPLYCEATGLESNAFVCRAGPGAGHVMDFTL